MADGLVTLVEITAYDPSVTNKVIRSEELDNAIWSKTAVTIVANAATAPDGTMSADTIVETAANAFHVVAQYTTGFTAGVPVMASGHLKANGRSRVRVQTDTSPNNGTADFDLAAGTVGGITGIASAPRLIPLGNGWWRFAVIWTPASSAAMGIKLILAASTYGVAYLGDGVSGMHGWGFMLDPSGTLNEYVRTTSVAGPGTRILRFASGRGRMTGPGDVPPHVHFAPRLQQPVNFSRTLFSNQQNASYQIVLQDFGKLVFCTSGTNTYTFPAAADLPDGWFCRLRNRSGVNLTLNPTGADTLNGSASLAIATGSAILTAARSGAGTFEVA